MRPEYTGDLCAAAQIHKASRGRVTSCDSHFLLHLIEFFAPLLDKRRKTTCIEGNANEFQRCDDWQCPQNQRVSPLY